MEQNISWRALSSSPHSWKHLPPSPRWGGKVQGAMVPSEPGSWPRVMVTGSGPFPAARIVSDPPSGQAAVVPGPCSGGGGGPTHSTCGFVPALAARGDHRCWNLGWEEAVPGWEGPFPQSRANTTTLLSPQLSATLTIPFWQWFLTRFGKKTAVYVGISVSVPSAVGMVFTTWHQQSSQRCPWGRGCC